jgi:ABC-type spermidine/putrescine transport system permease subunit II
VTAQRTPAPRNLLGGGIGLLMVLCCLSGPAVIGAIGGSAIGGVLGIAVAAALAVAAAAALHRRSRRGRRVC